VYEMYNYMKKTKFIKFYHMHYLNFKDILVGSCNATGLNKKRQFLLQSDYCLLGHITKFFKHDYPLQFTDQVRTMY